VKTLDQVEYNQETLKTVRGLPVIKENYTHIVKDFERIYMHVLTQELPDEVPDEHLSKTKTDLLCAYLYGAYVSCDMKSMFRQNFKLPEKSLKDLLATDKKIIKPSIIL